MRRSGVVISAAPRADGALSVVLVDGSTIVLSNGVELLARYDKLQTLCWAVCQEQAEVSVRTWIASDGEELIELHRVGAAPTKPSTGTTLTQETSF